MHYLYALPCITSIQNWTQRHEKNLNLLIVSFMEQDHRKTAQAPIIFGSELSIVPTFFPPIFSGCKQRVQVHWSLGIVELRQVKDPYKAWDWHAIVSLSTIPSFLFLSCHIFSSSYFSWNGKTIHPWMLVSSGGGPRLNLLVRKGYCA